MRPGVLPRLLLLVCSAACAGDGAAAPSGPLGRILPESLLIWRDSAVSGDSRPVFDDHAVYVLTNHTAFAVDKKSGAPLWTTALVYPTDVKSPQGYGTALASGLIIIGDIDVFGLSPQSGAIVWRFAPRLLFPNERSFYRLASDGTTIYGGGVWGNVYAIDGASGTQRWVTHVTTLPDSAIRVFTPVVANGVIYTPFTDEPAGTGQLNGGIAAINATTGALLWSQFLPHHGGNTSETQSVAVTPTRIVAGAWDGYLYGLDPTTGAILDTVPQTTFGFVQGTTLGGWFRLAVIDTTVIAGLSSGPLVALDARHLQQKLWTGTLNYGAIWDIVADSGRVYVDYLSGQLGIMDRANGKTVWWLDRSELRHAGEGVPWAPALDGDRIYVGADHDVFAFQRR